ncbi:uncharacterized protein TNCV_2543381 [Trichonephila clavipes]|nr:uncharacterized protein TNCV_2543381 [Trichonephila clavipes]
MFSSVDRVTVEMRARFQQLQNLSQKYAFLSPEVILSMDKLNLDQALQNINKEEFQLERERLQAFVAVTEPGCKKELIRSGSLWIVRVQYFVRGGFVGHRSHASSKHLSSHLPVDGVRFLEGQKGVALQLQDARVGVGSNKDADHSRCSEK